MYTLGAKVTYPQHGAGIVEAIEEREILGVLRSYYVLRFHTENGRVLVPVDGKNGLRSIVSPEEMGNVLNFLSQSAQSEAVDSWNRRYRENLERIKTGDIYQVAGVVRELTLRSREKGLAAGEQRMLAFARTLLLSEMSLTLDEPMSLMEDKLDAAI